MLRILLQETRQQAQHFMLSDFTEMQLLSNLMKCIHAKKTLDIGKAQRSMSVLLISKCEQSYTVFIDPGVYTGYSALSIALALPEDGTLVAMDIDDEMASIGKKYWQMVGFLEIVTSEKSLK